MPTTDEPTDLPKESAATYAAIIEGIRSHVDAIVCPPVSNTGSAPLETPQQRFALHEELARRGLLEWVAVDPGSVNLASSDDLRADREGFVYLNPERPSASRPWAGGARSSSPHLRDLRAWVRAPRSDAALALRLPRSDLPLVFLRLHVQLPARRLRIDGRSEPPRPGGPRCKMDGRGLGRRHPAAGPAYHCGGRTCARGPGGRIPRLCQEATFSWWRTRCASAKPATGSWRRRHRSVPSCARPRWGRRRYNLPIPSAARPS
jgi:hypothetical protein